MCNGTILLSFFYFTDSYLYQLQHQDLLSPVRAGICGQFFVRHLQLHSGVTPPGGHRGEAERHKVYGQGLLSLTNGVHFGVSASLLLYFSVSDFLTV